MPTRATDVQKRDSVPLSWGEELAYLPVPAGLANMMPTDASPFVLQPRPFRVADIGNDTESALFALEQGEKL